MGELINLVPWFAARRIAAELQRREGLGYFTLTEPDGPAFRLDPLKLDMVVELGKLSALQSDPFLPMEPRDLATCRRLIRRELIHDLAVDLLHTGH